MVVKITCNCNASFEIKDGVRHPKAIVCPNCGKSLPDDASKDVFALLESFSSLEAKLEDSCYGLTLILDR